MEDQETLQEKEKEGVEELCVWKYDSQESVCHETDVCDGMRNTRTRAVPVKDERQHWQQYQYDTGGPFGLRHASHRWDSYPLYY